MLTLEACKALKETGYPQEDWPQFIFREGKKKPTYVRHWAILPPYYFACPSDTDALDWLEKKGYRWWRNHQGRYGALTPLRVGGEEVGTLAILLGKNFADPSALILAIHQHFTRKVAAPDQPAAPPQLG